MSPAERRKRIADLERGYTADNDTGLLSFVCDLETALESVTAERDELRRLVALAKSYRNCSRDRTEAGTTDEEIETMVDAELDAENALLDALDAHDAAADAARGKG